MKLNTKQIVRLFYIVLLFVCIINVLLFQMIIWHGPFFRWVRAAYQFNTLAVPVILIVTGAAGFWLAKRHCASRIVFIIAALFCGTAVSHLLPTRNDADTTGSCGLNILF